jgi:hypothetical protein
VARRLAATDNHYDERADDARSPNASTRAYEALAVPTLPVGANSQWLPIRTCFERRKEALFLPLFLCERWFDLEQMRTTTPLQNKAFGNASLCKAKR